MSQFWNVFRNQHVLLPVIPVRDRAQALANAQIAWDAGADGVSPGSLPTSEVRRAGSCANLRRGAGDRMRLRKEAGQASRQPGGSFAGSGRSGSEHDPLLGQIREQLRDVR